MSCDDTLVTALHALGSAEDEGLPVLSADDVELVGWLTHRDLLTAYRQRLPGGGDSDDVKSRRN